MLNSVAKLLKQPLLTVLLIRCLVYEIIPNAKKCNYNDFLVITNELLWFLNLP